MNGGKLAKLYTRTGDRGETGLLAGLRVSKTDPRIEAIGALDELNASLGVVLSLQVPKVVQPQIEAMQRTLFNLGAHLAGAETVGVTDNDVAKLEAAIDKWTAMSPPISTFILPGGTPTAAELHRSRTIARRAERRVLALQSATAAPFKAYLNRLSDALFAAARVANAAKGISETPWKNKS